MAFTPLEPMRLSDRAVNQIRNMISRGELKPGEKLPSEKELVASLGVGRTSVREAVRILVGMNLLTVKPGRGVFVLEDAEGPRFWKPWLIEHRDTVLELLDAREAVEIPAMMLAAEKIADQQLHEIQAFYEQIANDIEHQDVEALVAHDHQFHKAICQASGNRFLIDFNLSLYEALANARRSVFTITPRVRPYLKAEHRAIVDALQARDPIAAREAGLVHMRNFRVDVLVAIEEQEA